MIPQRGSTTGLVISGYGLSPFLFTTVSHFFFPDNTSAFLLLLALGTSLPMIMGFFLVRPIPLPVQDNSDIEEGRDHDYMEAISSALDSHTHGRTPLLDHDEFAMQGSRSATVIRTGIKSARIDGENFALDDIPIRSPNGVPTTSPSSSSSQSRRPNTTREVAILNLHGRQLWTSIDFWLLFTILAIRKCIYLFFLFNYVSFPSFFFSSERNGFGVYVRFFTLARVCVYFFIDINNVGTISQVLYAHKNSKYDKVKASGWQVAQVSLISIMSFIGRILIGMCFFSPSSFSL